MRFEENVGVVGIVFQREDLVCVYEIFFNGSYGDCYLGGVLEWV